MKLFPHQERVLDDTYNHNRVAYYLDMGLGKTFVGSEKLWELNTPYNLVICQKSQINDWIKHFEMYYPEYKVIKFNEQSNIPEDSILVINYDLVWRRPRLLKLRNFTLLLDESSMIKNEKSKRTKFILDLQPDNVILLSGTPTGGKYEELWSQCKLLGWNIPKKTFLNQFCLIKFNKLWGGMRVVGYKNVERLKAKLRMHGAVFMKTEEVFDLPEQNFITVECKKSTEYKTFNRDRIIDFAGKTYLGDSSTTARLYLRQFAGHLNKNKIERLKELLESTDDRVLIFYNFNDEHDAIKKLCDDLKKPTSVIRGGSVDKSNYEKYENSVTLIQYQAGAMGHNLQKSNKIVYFTLPDKSLLFEQSKKRTHRIGQERPCFYYYLMTENSIEQKILKALEMRKDYTDELFREEFEI